MSKFCESCSVMDSRSNPVTHGPTAMDNDAVWACRSCRKEAEDERKAEDAKEN